MLDHIDRLDSLHLRRHGTYESAVQAVMSANLKLGDTFIDVGAHIGIHACHAAEIVGPKGLVYAFEPERSNFTLLEKNLEKYRDRAFALQLAVGEKMKWVRLHLSEKNSGDHRVYESEIGRTRQKIKMITLDSIFDCKISLLKTDTQGYDYYVLRGARQLIERHDVFKAVVEFYPSGMRWLGFGPDVFFGLLSELGFKIMLIPKSGGTPEPFKEKVLSSVITAENGRHVNLFCVKGG